MASWRMARDLWRGRGEVHRQHNHRLRNNNVIRSLVLELHHKYRASTILGFRYGWAGVLAGDCAPLTYENTRGILHRGGTILGTSRTNPYKEEGGLEQLKAVLAPDNPAGLS